MDPVILQTLANRVLVIIVRELTQSTNAAEGLGIATSEEISKRAAISTDDQMPDFMEAVLARFKDRPTLIEAIGELAKSSQDQDAQAVFRLQLRKTLESDPAFADELRKLIQVDTSENYPGSAVIASGNRSVAVGRDINAPVFTGDIVKSIVKIYTAFPVWLRGVLFLILSGVGLTLVLVIALFLQNNPLALPEPTPDPNKFAFVEASRGFAITALAIAGDTLWMGAKKDGRFSFYSLDTRQKTKAGLEPVHVVNDKILALVSDGVYQEWKEPGKISGIMVDCKKNLWIQLIEIGVLVYRPDTKPKLETLLNIATTKGILTKNTTNALASRCDNAQVEVWLGREGVHTLRYEGDYPSLEIMEKLLLPKNQDVVFRNTEQLADVKAFYYTPGDKTLWIADSTGKLRGVSPDGALAPQIFDAANDSFWSLSQAIDGTIWAGGANQIKKIRGSAVQTISLDQPESAQANSIQAHHSWVWFGSSCSNVSCLPLWSCSSPASSASSVCSPVKRFGAKEVRSIVVDSQNVLWIGTENGLIIFP